MKGLFKKFICAVLISFLVLESGGAHAQALLPEQSPIQGNAFTPLIFKGLTIHTDNPLLFDFILDTGNTNLSPTSDATTIKKEANKLVKYFLASLALPEQDQWVNLSPFEKDRILPEDLGKTELGRDMLAQDYILKQITAAFLNPERTPGKEFWAKVYALAAERLGTTNIPVDAFNKVWIAADKAEIYVKNNTAVIAGSHLKVMLESDYQAKTMAAPTSEVDAASTATQEISKQIMREIILPELEKEINTSKNFANLRQIFHSMILATWYKKNFKKALLTQVYADQRKTPGVEGAWVKRSNADLDPLTIWTKYEEAYKKGAFNFIKEDADLVTGEIIPRKYISGGIVPGLDLNNAQTTTPVFKIADMAAIGEVVSAQVQFNINNADNSGATAIPPQNFDNNFKKAWEERLSAGILKRNPAKNITRRVGNFQLYVTPDEEMLPRDPNKPVLETEHYGQTTPTIYTDPVFNNTVMFNGMINQYPVRMQAELTPLLPYQFLLLPMHESRRWQIFRDTDMKEFFELFEQLKFDSNFRFFYSSTNAGSVVNKFHFQGLRVSEPLPIEKAPILETRTDYTGALMSKIDYPAKGIFLIRGPQKNVIAFLTDVIGDYKKKEFPFNLIICPDKVFILSRENEFGVIDGKPYDLDAIAMSGLIRVPSQEVLNRFTEENINKLFSNTVKKWLDFAETSRREMPVDNAARFNGGIDMNGAEMSMTETGAPVNVELDQAMLAQFKKGDFSGITPVIMTITPIQSLAALLQ